ncbi:heme transporter [Gordonia sp. NB41Y]|uniref:heme transporter n=1 Tax=Gordonia sp. NB41Y TaxID=875808 RepID=UPI0006B208A0|nr:heme transporter [Gordonia sp. NB41Y]EMP10173.2 heme transporter [Gordonia sp. NB41Y]WLP91428.1 heme transporter [Gordonia sp. NB41Y]
MPATPDDPTDSPAVGPDAAASRPCGRHFGCRCRAGSDLQALLDTPGFAGTVIDGGVQAAVAALPHLDQVVGVTVAGPVVMNAVGMHHAPELPGGPLRCGPSRISLRINPARLGTVLITEPAAHLPPTLRWFDAEGNTAHATYLTERSDRLAFESIALATPEGLAPAVPEEQSGTSVDTDVSVDPGAPATDQIAQFDSILDDHGVSRRESLPGLTDQGCALVEPRRVIAALEHAALLGMPMTLAATGPGCVQLHHDHLDGAREHRGQMVLASGGARMMVDFAQLAECWVTRADGVWGPTGSIELYDRRGRCALIATQTGPVAAGVFEGWQQLVSDLVH